MPQPTEIEKDPFLVLLTDALRAGPGSPEWREAIAKLKLSPEETDEYRILIDAREALESGKDYRSVRAGPGFTRKLLNNLESEQPASARRPFPLTGFIAVLAAVVIAVVIGVAIYQLYPRASSGPAPRGNLDELANTYLPTTVLSTSFDSGIPSQWRQIGNLPVQADKGLSAAKTGVPDNYMGGGVVVTTPLAADQTFSATVTVQIRSTGEALIPQIFVASSPDFSLDRATAAQELVWELEGDEQKVVVGGRVEKQSKIPPKTQTLTVRLILNKDLAVVESNGTRIWSGPHALGDAPRYMGVRFIRTNGKSVADISFKEVHVQKN